MKTTITHTQVEIFAPVLVYHDNNHTHVLRYFLPVLVYHDNNNHTHTQVEIFVPVPVYYDNNNHTHTS